MAKKKLSKKKQEERKIKKILAIIIVYLVLLVWLILGIRKYNFVNVLFPLWYVALALGVVAAIIFVWLFIKKFYFDDKSGRKTVIGLSFAVVLVVFFVFGSLFAYMNHIFDRTEPERYVVTIEDKYYHGGAGRYSIGNYEFRVTIDGKRKEIDVPRLHAYQFREGDFYVVEYHKGAFNEPYYIGVGAP